MAEYRETNSFRNSLGEVIDYLVPFGVYQEEITQDIDLILTAVENHPDILENLPSYSYILSLKELLVSESTKGDMYIELLCYIKPNPDYIGDITLINVPTEISSNTDLSQDAEEEDRIEFKPSMMLPDRISGRINIQTSEVDVYINWREKF